MKSKSYLEAQFSALLGEAKLPVPKEEWRFDTKRRWRFDFAWPKWKVAVEIEGGIWTYGRHNRASGYIKDMEKYNRATMLRWKVLRYHADSMPDAIPALKKLLK